MTKRAPICRGRHKRWRVLASWLPAIGVEASEANARAFYAKYNAPLHGGPDITPVDPDEMIHVQPRQRNREVSNA